jgi:hypothetical protein
MEESTAMTITDTPIELDSRTADGIDVSLLWHPAENRVTVVAADARTGEVIEIEVRDHSRALEAFHHPYSYVA